MWILTRICFLQLGVIRSPIYKLQKSLVRGLCFRVVKTCVWCGYGEQCELGKVSGLYTAAVSCPTAWWGCGAKPRWQKCDLIGYERGSVVFTLFSGDRTGVLHHCPWCVCLCVHVCAWICKFVCERVFVCMGFDMCIVCVWGCMCWPVYCLCLRGVCFDVFVCVCVFVFYWRSSSPCSEMCPCLQNVHQMFPSARGLFVGGWCEAVGRCWNVLGRINKCILTVERCWQCCSPSVVRVGGDRSSLHNLANPLKYRRFCVVTTITQMPASSSERFSPCLAWAWHILVQIRARSGWELAGLMHSQFTGTLHMTQVEACHHGYLTACMVFMKCFILIPH